NANASTLCAIAGSKKYILMNICKKFIGNSFLLITIISSCSNITSKNQQLIQSIDKIKNIDTVYQIKVDTRGNKIDTIAVIRIKKSKKGSHLYYELKSTSKDNTKHLIKKYFRNNGELFYQFSESISSTSFTSTHE